MTTATCISPEQVTGLILAGGRGTRMGHVDKGLTAFFGKPLVAHAMERLTAQTASLAISANRSLQTYAAFHVPVWSDLLSDFPGPLAGVQSGLARCQTDYLVTVPCDSPLLPHDLVVRLSHALLSQSVEAAFAVTGALSNRRAQPVFCLLNTSLLPSLTSYLNRGGRKMEDWLQEIHAAQAWFEDDHAFSNINTLQELQAMETGPHLA